MESLSEGVEIRFLPSEQRDAEVARLVEPWIGDEGALDAGFRRGLGDEPLRPRGVAFDPRITVVWDEAGVQVVQAGELREDVVALRSPVLLHARFQEKGPRKLFRIDYLRRGALLGSRFTLEGGNDA
ncbi:MAG TPA: hypothetical protein VLB76_14345 [Thermoanaerobaculia bacterium]|jgi:hypothetical protein|nr:hypothetical protein [Thermoanaerobaculia bacterium]